MASHSRSHPVPMPWEPVPQESTSSPTDLAPPAAGRPSRPFASAGASASASSDVALEALRLQPAAPSEAGADAQAPAGASHPNTATGALTAATAAAPGPAPSWGPQVCSALQRETALATTASDAQWLTTPLLDPALTFQLHSDPTATRLIYLDFDGHTTSGTSWNTSTMGSSFSSPAYDIDGNPASFSSSELTRIQQIWQHVAADFAPFDVDVTTQAPPLDWLSRSSSSDTTYGIRVVVTSYGPSSSSAGGISFVGSFTSSTDTPAFIYNTSVIGVAEATSHEVGHTLGLSHDGTASYEYYGGHGTGETSWAPIMGAGYSRSVTTWDDGTFSGSTNTGSTANYGRGADDLAVIVANNGFGYQPDLVGNSLASASPLSISGGTVAQFGRIETRTDSDWYSFQLLNTGSLSLTFDPYRYRAYVDSDGSWGGSSTGMIGPASDSNTATPYPENTANLDLAAQLYDSGGVLLFSADGAGLASSIDLPSLPAATYYLRLDGVGCGTPTASPPSGYSDYASIGNYCISGVITTAADNAGGSSSTPPNLSAANLSQLEGTSSTASTFLVSVSLDRASTSTITLDYQTLDDTAVSTGSSPDFTAASGQVVIAAGSLTATVAIRVNADATVESDESFRIAFSNPVGASLATSQALVVIVNDDSSTSSGGKTTGKRTKAAPEPAAAATLLATDALTGIDHAGAIACPDAGGTTATAAARWPVGHEPMPSTEQDAAAAVIAAVDDSWSSLVGCPLNPPQPWAASPWDSGTTFPSPAHSALLM